MSIQYAVNLSDNVSRIIISGEADRSKDLSDFYMLIGDLFHSKGMNDIIVDAAGVAGSPELFDIFEIAEDVDRLIERHAGIRIAVVVPGNDPSLTNIAWAFVSRQSFPLTFHATLPEALSWLQGNSASRMNKWISAA